MRLDELINQTSEWLKGTGPDSNIVISSRIRLARNIEGLRFADWADLSAKKRIAQAAKQAVLSSNYMKNSLYVEMDKINPIDRQLLIERHLISREHVVDPEHKTTFIGDREMISIMVNTQAIFDNVVRIINSFSIVD